VLQRAPAEPHLYLQTFYLALPAAICGAAVPLWWTSAVLRATVSLPSTTSCARGVATIFWATSGCAISVRTISFFYSCSSVCLYQLLNNADYSPPSPLFDLACDTVNAHSSHIRTDIAVIFSCVIRRGGFWRSAVPSSKVVAAHSLLTFLARRHRIPTIELFVDNDISLTLPQANACDNARGIKQTVAWRLSSITVPLVCRTVLLLALPRASRYGQHALSYAIIVWNGTNAHRSTFSARHLFCPRTLQTRRDHNI